jgi:RNA polymerase-binding transcription factor
MAKEKKSASKDKKAKDMKKKKTTAGKPVKKSTEKVSVVSKNKTATKKSKTGTKSASVKSKTRKREAEILDAESTAAARAKALEKIKGYSKKDLEHFRKIIIERQNEIIEQLQNLKDQMMDPTTGEYINENSPYSLHMAEQGTDAMEREKTFLYAQRENKFLGYLEEALKRIDAGTYGICIECIEKPQHLCETCPLIPKARLEAVPHSQLCLPMKQKQEKK